MIVLDAKFTDVHYARDFGQVEAMVTLFIKMAHQPARPMSIYTNVAARGAEPLRLRLLQDAARMIKSKMDVSNSYAKVA
ncbi:hypothetical protein LCGC14_1715070 [marine sediment metagenome]|uniref:Uncharacterized protein n=1 Tax=marine sediment metagenome TaxID=412755 RepID=A0A0F9KE55_9ZZZZ